MITSREIRLKSRVVGAPVADNFELATVSVPAPALGEVQVKNLWMSVDPYMRGRMVDRSSYDPHPPLGGATPAREIGQVADVSKRKGFGGTTTPSKAWEHSAGISDRHLIVLLRSWLDRNAEQCAFTC